jgi:hypothetical protein
VTDTTPGSPNADDPGETARRMRAIATELTAAGLGAHLHDTRGALDITATVYQPAVGNMPT